MDPMISLIIATIASGTGIIAAIAWIIKSIAVHFLNKDIENYKKKLQLETEKYQLHLQKELETHRAEMNLFHSQQVQLYTEKVVIIREIYDNLQIFHEDLFILTNPLKQVPVGQKFESYNQSLIEKATLSGNAFLLSFKKHRIFLDKEICDLITDLQIQFRDAFYKYVDNHRNSEYASYDIRDNDLGIDSKERRASFDVIQENIPPIKEKLESHFRKILGVIVPVRS